MRVERIAACDISTFAVDVVTLPLDPESTAALTHDRVELRKKSQSKAEQTWAATLSLRYKIPVLPLWEDVRVVFIERGFGASRRADWALGRVQGALAVSIPDHVLIHEATISEWKGELTGNGMATKDLVQRTLLYLGYPEQADENAYDALGLCHAMRAKNARASGIT